MNLDSEAKEHILELESQLEDAHVTIDLQQEFINELQDALKAAKGQLAQLKVDRKVAV